VVERQLPKLNVAGSIPVTRSNDNRPMGKSMVALRLAPLALLLVMASGTALAESPVGVWDTGKANVRIYDCGGKLCGRITSLHKPKNPDGTDKVDAHNPDPAKRKRKIVGLHILRGFVQDKDEANYWTRGRIYNPEDGDVYKCTLTLRKDGKLRVRGYVGIPLLGKTQIWTRVK
jgi:uncharacterized protein (DUF2147 family)